MEEEPNEVNLHDVMVQAAHVSPDVQEPVSKVDLSTEENVDQPSDAGAVVLSSASNRYNSCITKGCCRKKCLTKLPKEAVLGVILSTMRLSQEQRDSFLAAKLHSAQSYTDKRRTIWYSFGNDFEICRTAFVQCFADSEHHMVVIQPLVHERTFTVPSHSRKGKFQPKRIDEAVKLKVTQFILRQADQYGLPMPYSKSTLNLLPRIYLSPRTKKTLIAVQYNSLVTAGCQVSPRSFCRIWKEQAAHVVIRDHHTDLCDTCDKLSSALRNSKRDFESKQAASLRWSEHLDRVKSERAEYKRCIDQSRLQYKAYGVTETTKFP